MKSKKLSRAVINALQSPEIERMLMIPAIVELRTMDGEPITEQQAGLVYDEMKAMVMGAPLLDYKYKHVRGKL